MKIKVTEEHIKNGIKFNPWFCPIGLALQVAQPNPQLSVGCDVIHDGEIDILMPENARKFRSDFDADRPVSPFEFDIDL